PYELLPETVVVPLPFWLTTPPPMIELLMAIGWLPSKLTIALLVNALAAGTEPPSAAEPICRTPLLTCVGPAYVLLVPARINVPVDVPELVVLVFVLPASVNAEFTVKTPVDAALVPSVKVPLPPPRPVKFAAPETVPSASVLQVKVPVSNVAVPRDVPS